MQRRVSQFCHWRSLVSTCGGPLVIARTRDGVAVLATSCVWVGVALAAALSFCTIVASSNAFSYACGDTHADMKTVINTIVAQAVRHAYPRCLPRCARCTRAHFICT